MANPVIAEVKRGSLVESSHTGSWAVADMSGAVLATGGEALRPVYPRSAIKAFQCVPLVASGAASAFNLSDEEVALACASHNGEAEHVRVARSTLAKAGVTEQQLECGAHWPLLDEAKFQLACEGGKALAIHNNCSGKHAGMLALATHLGVDPRGYVNIDHPVQARIADALSQYCDVKTAELPVAVDGCSVPTWAFPLTHMARGFARLTRDDDEVGQRIITAVRAAPFMVAGTGRFDTRIMQAVPRLFAKVGAEGVYCGSIPHAHLGFAMKCDDGAGRAAEVAIAALLASLDVWTPAEKSALQSFAQHEMKNWRQTPVGNVQAVRF